MFNWKSLLLIAFLLVSRTSVSQTTRTGVTGKVEPVEDGTDLFVELRESSNRMLVEREPVARDGSFRFHDVPIGSYEIRVITVMHGTPLTEQFVEIHPLCGPLVLHLPSTVKARPVSGVVSVRDLQARVPKNAWQAFVKAQHYSDRAKTDQAIEQLRRAISFYPGWRDAHVNLASQLVKSGRYEDGLLEIQEAIRIGPPSAIAYTNGAAALVYLHRLPEAEQMARTALRVDPAFLRGHFMLGHILAHRLGSEKEALDHLRTALPEVPVARIVAAQVLARLGDRETAVAELKTYLKSPNQSRRTEAKKLIDALR